MPVYKRYAVLPIPFESSCDKSFLYQMRKTKAQIGAFVGLNSIYFKFCYIHITQHIIWSIRIGNSSYKAHSILAFVIRCLDSKDISNYSCEYLLYSWTADGSSFTRSLKMSQLIRFWYLSHRRPAKDQASLRTRAVSPEPSLFAHMQYGSRWRVRPKLGLLSPLNGCACAFEECVYGGRKVP